MAVKRKTQSRSMPQSIAMGACVGIIVCVVLSGVLAALISSGNIREEGMPIGVMVVLFLSSCCGCILSAKLAKAQIAIQCAITAAVLIALQLGANIMLFNAEFSNWWSKILAVILGAVIGCVLCAGIGKKGRHR